MDNFLRQTAAGQVEGSSALLPPEISGYRTERLLGVGASAAVWLFRDQISGEAQALKVFPAPEAGQRGIAELRREIAILGRLTHPHLLGIRDVLTTDQGPALLMPYAAGGSLADLIAARGKLSVGEAVTILTPVAQVLAYLHSESVLHGDVSPGNVLLTSDGKPLLADLGIGRLLGEGHGDAEGTPGFMDRASGSGSHLSLAADVYSLASLGWYSLTGQPAGPARQRPPLTLIVPEVPSELLSILEAGLHEDPDERPSAGEFALAVIRSAAPRPLDLVPAVHPTVRPELLTRRAARNQPHAPKRRFRLHRPADQSTSDAGRVLKRSRRSDSRGRRTSISLGFVAAVLVASGALIAAPHLLEAAAGPSQEAGATPSELDPVAPEGSSPSAEEMLSPEMQARLAGEDPLEVLPALAVVRARAFATANAELLAHVNAGGSEIMAADQDVVAALQSQGQVFRGLSVRLEQLEIAESVSSGATSTAIAAVAVTSAYSVVDNEGATVREVSEATPQELVFVLEHHDGLWKIAAVHEAGTA